MTTERPTDDALRIERTLAAPIGLAWAMWTDPSHFAAWYGPDGATVEVLRLDPTVGGARLIAMTVTTPDGPLTMHLGGEHLEVVEPTRLVYTESRADADGTLHPPATEITVTLSTEGPGTRMVLVHVGVPGDSPGATGWRMALDQLAARLLSVAGT